MKKLGQKLSFLTKIMLVVGLLISNLSSLSIVFAYEASDDLVILLNGNKLEISYTEQVAEEVESVNVKVYEKYSYSEYMSEEEVVTNIALSEEQVLALKEGTLKLEHSSIFDNGDDVVTNYEIFDGVYTVKVEFEDLTVYEDNSSDDEQSLEGEVILEGVEATSENESEETVTIIASNTYEKEMLHRSGLEIKVYNAETNEEISLVDGKYPVSINSSKVKVVAQVLSGGIKPDDMFMVGEEELSALALINKVFTKDADFMGHLFGEHNIPLEVKILKKLPVVSTEDDTEIQTDAALENSEDVTDIYEEIVYKNDISVMYESYIANAMVLNDSLEALNYDGTYLFFGEEKEGNLYILSSFENEDTVLTTEENAVTKSMLDIYNVIKHAVGDSTDESGITYTLVKNGINVMESFDETAGITVEEYLSTIMLDETVTITLSCGDLEIGYNVIYLADLNEDGMVSEVDLLELIDQTIGASEITDINKSDVYKFDEKLDSFDVLYLNQIINYKEWNSMIETSEVVLNSNLEILFNEKELNEENYLVSGDKFTVNYVLSLSDYDVNGIAGLFDYNSELFELISVKVNYDWIGNNHNGKFIYLGGEVLTKPEIDETIPEVPEEEITTEDDIETLTDDSTTESDEEEVVKNDYVVLTATFKALKATSEEDYNIITLKNIELFNTSSREVIYYVLNNNVVSTDVIPVKASDDNTLSYLEVAGMIIELEDDKYDYEITVKNEVTTVDLKYILNNIAASVTSEIYPEELVQGSNSVVITVVSESGLSQDYTITVNREEAPKETTQVSNNYYQNNYEEDKEEEVIVNPNEKNDDDSKKEEKDSNLSRIIIIILIFVVIAGLVYLIFKDDEDEETKKVNKDINKLKKESIDTEVKEVKTTTKTEVKKTSTGKTTNNASGKTSSKSSAKAKTSKK